MVILAEYHVSMNDFRVTAGIPIGLMTIRCGYLWWMLLYPIDWHFK